MPALNWALTGIRSIARTGLRPGDSDALTRRLRQTNFLALLAIGFSFATLAFDLTKGFLEGAVVDLSLAVAFVLPLLLSRHRYHSASRLALILIPNSAILFLSMAHGPRAGVQYLYFVLAGVPFLIFSREERKATIAAVATAIVPYMYLELRDYSSGEWIPKIAYPDGHQNYMILFALCMIAGMNSYFRKMNAQAQAKLENTIREIQELHDRGAAMLEALPDGMLRIKSDGTIVDCHRAEATPIRLAAAEILGRKLDEVVSEELWSAGFDQILLAMDSAKPLELRVTIQAGAEASSYEVRCVRSGEGEVTVITRNISEAIAAERLIEKQKVMMINSSKMSALGEMTGAMGHEINNPLMVIRGNADIIARLSRQEGNEDSVEVEKSAAKIIQMTERIARIIKSIRTMSRNGEQDPVEPVAVGKIVADAVDLCRERMRAHGIALEIGDIPAELGIECRMIQIGQILVNLLNNAHDAIVDRTERWIRISARESEGLIQILVTDSGQGIPADVQAKIFEPFFTTKKVGMGSGLGLSVAKGIAESHGGTLHFDLTVPNTTFVLSLPKTERVILPAPPVAS